MARVEHMQASLDHLEHEVESMHKEIKKNRRSRSGCLIAFVVFVGVVVAGGAYVAARTGVAEVPVLSRLLYRDPQPTRVVTPSSGKVRERLLADFNGTVQRAAQQGTLPDVKMTHRFSEAEFSGLLWEEIQKNELLSKRINTFQVVLTLGEIEIFSNISVNGRPLFFTVRINPELVGSRLNLKVTHAQVGALTVPRQLGGVVVKGIVERGLNQALDMADTFVEVQDLIIDEGSIDVTVLIMKQL